MTVLAEVLDKHDVAAVVVEFRIENIAAVRGDGQSHERAATANLEHRSYLPGKIEVVQGQIIVLGKKVNTAWRKLPVSREGQRWTLAAEVGPFAKPEERLLG